MSAVRRLGRGVKATRKAPKAPAGEEVINLDVDLIDANPEQPREVFDKEALAALEASIGTDGVLQPIVVRQFDDRYELVMGERRLRAATNAGRRHIPAIVRRVTDTKMLELSLIENLQREDLNPIEKANAYKNMIEKLSITQDDASKRLGIARATVANFIRLLDLSEEVQQHVSRGTLSMGHARALLAIRDKVKRLKAARRVITGRLSVRQTEALASPPEPKNARAQPPLTIELQTIQDSMREALGTKVSIQGTHDKGKIVLQYYTKDDLDRILQKIVPFNV